MKYDLRLLSLLIGLAIVVGGAGRGVAQDCPCVGSGETAWFNEGNGCPSSQLGEFPSGEFANNRNNMAACSGPFCGYSCRAEGFVFSTEMTLVNVWQTSNSDLGARLLAAQVPAAGLIENLRPDLDTAPLITFGYTTCEGLGFQGRFWDFDTAISQGVVAAVPADPNLVTHAWDALVFDMEATYSSLYAQVWDIMLSGGYRFAEYEEGATTRNAAGASNSVSSQYFGNGVTGGVGVRRQITSHLSLMFAPRFSFLLGGETVTVPGNLNLPAQPIGNKFDVRYIAETKVGINYEFPICGGGVWFTRAGYEVQYWNDFVPSIDNRPRAASTLFNGFFLAVGLQR